jgi:hypothetical protein
MAQTTGSSSASRISEAFSFLKEYQVGLAFDETKADAICNGSPHINGEEGEFTIITYVESEKNFDRSSTKNKGSENQNADFRTVSDNGSDRPNDSPASVTSFNHKENDSRDSKGSGNVTIKDVTNNERTSSKVISNCSCDHLKVDNSNEEKVVMRRERNTDVKNCVSQTSVSKYSDSQSNSSSSCDVRKEETRSGRGTNQVVSDAFNFLKDLEDGRSPDHRESGIPPTGAEDKLFKKLSLVSKPQEKPGSGTAENHYSINSSSTDGRKNSDGLTIAQNKGSLRRQRNVSNHSLDNSDDSSDDDTGMKSDKDCWRNFICFSCKRMKNVQ